MHVLILTTVLLCQPNVAQWFYWHACILAGGCLIYKHTSTCRNESLLLMTLFYIKCAQILFILVKAPARVHYWICASCSITVSTHSSFPISGSARVWAGALTGLMGFTDKSRNYCEACTHGEWGDCAEAIGLCLGVKAWSTGFEVAECETEWRGETEWRKIVSSCNSNHS